MLNPHFGHTDMKKYILNFWLILVLLFSWPGSSFSQTILNGETSEKVVLFSDRSLYVAGEQVQFYAKVFSNSVPQKNIESQVLYCELITPVGNKVSGNKYLLSQNSAVGCISIPAEQVSGIYYLRAYTKVMRNYGPEAYAYIQVKVVNPGREDVLDVDNAQKNSSFHVALAEDFAKGNLFSFEMNKQLFVPGESVSLEVKSSPGIDTETDAMCLSVIPEAARPLQLIPQPTKFYIQAQTPFYTEDRGLSLSGKLTGAGGSSMQDKVVNLSIIGEGRDFMAARTDTAGRFFFVLPEYFGKRDLFLCAEKTNIPDVKIWVDNDFCSLPVNLPSPVFSLSENERQVVLDMSMNHQIELHFYADPVQDSVAPGPGDKPFYGDPTSMLYIDKYVQLPTLEEYFNELPTQVKVRKRSGEKYFKVIGSYDLSFYDPLVLVDWVAVDETEHILAVAPQNVARIEIVNQMYVKGGQTYGGIISIISKKGDFAGIDLPSTGIFINFRFLAQNRCDIPDSKANASAPDVRNTILWKPGISVLDKANSTFTFSAPASPGKYTALLEGVMKNGERFSQVIVFEVRN